MIILYGILNICKSRKSPNVYNRSFDIYFKLKSFDERSSEIVRNENTTDCIVDMNLSQLSKMRRNYIRSESFTELLPINETIEPINRELNDENCFDRRDRETTSETSPKYCCTLEVKFVWYEIVFHIELI